MHTHKIKNILKDYKEYECMKVSLDFLTAKTKKRNTEGDQDYKMQ